MNNLFVHCYPSHSSIMFEIKAMCRILGIFSNEIIMIICEQTRKFCRLGTLCIVSELTRPIHKNNYVSHTDLKFHDSWGRWRQERVFLHEASRSESWDTQRCTGGRFQCLKSCGGELPTLQEPQNSCPFTALSGCHFIFQLPPQLPLANIKCLAVFFFHAILLLRLAPKTPQIDFI